MASAADQPRGFSLGEKDSALVIHPDPWDLWFGDQPAQLDSEGQGAAQSGQIR